MSVPMIRTRSVIDRASLNRQAVLKGSLAIMATAVVFIAYEQLAAESVFQALVPSLSPSIVGLVPYALSAAIAAATATSLTAVLPRVRVAEPASKIVYGLRELSDGDLNARVRLTGDDPLKEVAIAFNSTAGSLSDQIAHWKIVNRQQWGVLCRIRQAVESNDSEQALRWVAEMEQNWDRIAEIEQRLVT